MQHSSTGLVLAMVLALGLAACDTDNGPAGKTTPTQCTDTLDNDNDGLADFPADPGCSSADDTVEGTAPTTPACADRLDNDADGAIDFPNDPGCTGATDTSEQNPPVLPACADGIDNNDDGEADFPADNGCASASDNNEADPTACVDRLDNDGDGKIDTLDPGCENSADNNEADPLVVPACADGVDNDADGKTDFPADAGCVSAGDSDEVNIVVPDVARTRYAMSNHCWALRSNRNRNYLVRGADGYLATATTIDNAEPFFMKPSALGNYLFYNRNRQLMSRGEGAAVEHVASASATDDADWTVIGVGDPAVYPRAPAYNVEPSKADITAYRGFDDPNTLFTAFTIRATNADRRLAVSSAGLVSTEAPNVVDDSQSFTFEPIEGCMQFPEAQSNFTGTPFSGTQPNGTVLGHADVHVHISATEFLGGAQWGDPFHKFGVEHALGDCSDAHGPTGQLDAVGGLFSQDPDGHDTAGWPTFPEWPGRDQLTHEAIYWKWLERSWASGLRVVVNDLVDNATLCELQRNASGTPTRDCNEMNNAGQQAGSMYAMQDYIDAQYGGRGEGFFQIVHSSDEAREVIEDGKMAVILGIEISNLFNCQITYSPLRSERPENETGNGGFENSYACTRESLVEQMNRIHDWGVRQVISIHEFDNAFGGNGIFDGMILNLGNRENSGGLPLGSSSPFAPDDTPTGEFWTTYNCPIEGGDSPTANFSGYVWEDAGGSAQSFLFQPACVSLATPPYSGGAVPCYPRDVRQCNARWMTPIGDFTYRKMMEKGFLIDWDHMELGMKTQLLELAEAQNPIYPFVSTHGTFGGTSVRQVERLLRNGGFIYPSNGGSRGFRGNMAETRGIYNRVFAEAVEGKRFLFGFGYGTDTNGLSAQTGPRPATPAGGRPFQQLTYPFTLFSGAPFSSIAGFTGVEGVVFNQPTSTDAEGDVQRSWSQDQDGNAHHGMLSDFVQEIRLEGTAQDMTDLFNSAEAYLQTWKRTEDAGAGIRATGFKPIAPPLRPASAEAVDGIVTPP